MKTTWTKRIGIALFAIGALTACKNPNATQETDGAEQPGPTPAEIDSSSIQRPGDSISTTVPKDLEGSNTSNN